VVSKLPLPETPHTKDLVPKWLVTRVYWHNACSYLSDMTSCRPV